MKFPLDGRDETKGEKSFIKGGAFPLPTPKNVQEEKFMKRNVVFIMVVTIGALCVFNTYGHCSSDMRPSDRKQKTVGTTYISGDPHGEEDVDMAAPVARGPVMTSYISGDPHDEEDVDVVTPVVRRPVVMSYISGDPHDEEDVDMVPPVVRRPVVMTYISGDPHEEEDVDMAVPTEQKTVMKNRR